MLCQKLWSHRYRNQTIPRPKFDNRESLLPLDPKNLCAAVEAKARTLLVWSSFYLASERGRRRRRSLLLVLDRVGDATDTDVVVVVVVVDVVELGAFGELKKLPPEQKLTIKSGSRFRRVRTKNKKSHAKWKKSENEKNRDWTKSVEDFFSTEQPEKFVLAKKAKRLLNLRGGFGCHRKGGVERGLGAWEAVALPPTYFPKLGINVASLAWASREKDSAFLGTLSLSHSLTLSHTHSYSPFSRTHTHTFSFLTHTQLHPPFLLSVLKQKQSAEICNLMISSKRRRVD